MSQPSANTPPTSTPSVETGGSSWRVGTAQTEEEAAREAGFWRDHTRISLTPVAAPSILGLYGFAASTFMVAANLAGWFGNPGSPLVLFPLAMTFGGLAQFMAAMWSYRARDALATAFHGTWGSFWLAYGLYMFMVASGALPAPTASPVARVAFGYWFIVLAAITWVCFVAASAQNLSLSLVLVALAAGATLLAIGLAAGVAVLVTIGAIVLVASAVLAYYTASAMMLQVSWGRVVLPMGTRTTPNRPGAIPMQSLGYERSEPGVKLGQ